MWNIGLLGAGRISGVHAEAIKANPKTKLVAVSDHYPEMAEKLADEYGATARSTDDIIADDGIDAVLIATSTNTHSDLMEAATKAGKAVFCEKPVDLDLKRARACQKAVASTGKPIMIGFNRRFDPNFSALKQALDQGEVGKAALLSISSFDPAPPPLNYIKVSGGIFRDMSIHDFDIANFIMGKAPKTITAIGSSLVDPEIGTLGDFDTAIITMMYDDGKMAVIKNSRRAAYGYDQRIEILGADGLLQAQNMLENTMVKSTNSGVTGAKPTYFFLERYMAAYKLEWNAFVDALETNQQMPITLADGITALAMAEAATLSVKTGTPIALADI